MDVEVGLLSLPCELHAMMLVQLSWRDFASLRLANRPLADGAGLCMLERLKAAAAAYASPAYSKVLQHDKLASWPVRSGALAVLLPASEWAALVSTASPLLEFWLRHELVAPQPVYLQYLCAARPPDRAVGPRGDTSGSFYRPVVGPEQLAAWATLRQLHLRALLRYDATSLPGGGIRGVVLLASDATLGAALCDSQALVRPPCVGTVRGGTCAAAGAPAPGRARRGRALAARPARRAGPPPPIQPAEATSSIRPAQCRLA